MNMAQFQENWERFGYMDCIDNRTLLGSEFDEHENPSPERVRDIIDNSPEPIEDKEEAIACYKYGWRKAAQQFND